MDDVKKGLTFFFLVVGLMIFYGVVILKIDVMTQQKESQLKELAANLSWEEHLYEKTMRSIMKGKQASQGSAVSQRE